MNLYTSYIFTLKSVRNTCFVWHYLDRFVSNHQSTTAKQRCEDEKYQNLLLLYPKRRNKIKKWPKYAVVKMKKIFVSN